MINRRAHIPRSRLAAKPPEIGSRWWLIAELDKHTSIAVRRRDPRCVTCGARQALQCSHFYSRRYLAIRFDLRNCNAMCAGCNRQHNSDPSPYLAYMLERYLELMVGLDGMLTSLVRVSDEELWRLLRECKA